MQGRKITLIEIGAGALPSVTPVVPRYASWFPTIYVAPDTPPVNEVISEPVADGVVIEWAAVDQAGVIYVIERGPTDQGPWTEIHRTTETRYLYSDSSGKTWHFRVTATVRGKPGTGTVIVATPSPTSAQLVEQQLQLAKETADRMEADAQQEAALADGLAQVGEDLAAEAAARVAGLAEAMQAVVDEAQARVDGLLNERLDRTAAISEVVETQQAENESLARQISEVAAGSGVQFDSRAIWNFDHSAEGWTGNGEPAQVDGWLRPANAAAFPYVQSPAGLDVDAELFRYVKLRVKRVGEPGWGGLLQWITTGDGSWNAGKSLQIPEPAWDSGGVAAVTLSEIAWAPGVVDAIRVQLGTAQTVSDYYLVDWVAVGRPSPGAGVALIQAVAEAVVTGDAAEARQRETLAVQLRGDYEGGDLGQVPTGLIASERNARVEADEAIVQVVEVIQARLPEGDGELATEASIATEREARVAEDLALATATQAINARLPLGDGAVASVEALDSVTARVEETELGLVNIGERVSSLDASFEGPHAGDEDHHAGSETVHAGNITVWSVIADGDHAQSRKTDAVKAEFGQFKATATQQIEAIADDVSAQAQQLTVVSAELEDKASAEAVEELTSRVEVGEDSITAMSRQLTSVKAEVDEKASAQVVQGMQATVTQTADGLAQVMAKAFLHVIADSGGGRLIGGMEIGNDGTTVATRFLSTVFEIISTDPTKGMEWRNGYLRVWNGAAQRIIGSGFGQAGDNLMDYFGPNVGAASASKSNAVMWMDANGSAYFGGQLSAGVLRNAVQTTTTQTVGAEVVNGPFATNGRARGVTVSFSRRHTRRNTNYGSSGFVAGAGANTAQVQIYRTLGNNAEQLWQVLNAGGSVDITNEFDGADTAISSWGGSFTVNETTSSTETIRYRAVIVGFTEQSVSHTSGSFNQQDIVQSLAIISVEQ
jgi:hypothetical protein